MNIYLAAAGLTPDGSLEFTLTVVIAGLGIVLATLALLILIFSLFGKLTARAEEKARQKNAKKSTSKLPAPPEIKKVSNIPPPPPIIESGVSDETVAVIAAAIYAYEGKDVKITSVRRKSSPARQNVWAQAATIQNTKPF